MQLFKVLIHALASPMMTSAEATEGVSWSIIACHNIEISQTHGEKGKTWP